MKVLLSIMFMFKNSPGRDTLFSKAFDEAMKDLCREMGHPLTVKKREVNENFENYSKNK